MVKGETKKVIREIKREHGDKDKERDRGDKNKRDRGCKERSQRQKQLKR